MTYLLYMVTREYYPLQELVMNKCLRTQTNHSSTWPPDPRIRQCWVVTIGFIQCHVFHQQYKMISTDSLPDLKTRQLWPQSLTVIIGQPAKKNRWTRPLGHNPGTTTLSLGPQFLYELGILMCELYSEFRIADIVHTPHISSSALTMNSLAHLAFMTCHCT